MIPYLGPVEDVLVVHIDDGSFTHLPEHVTAVEAQFRQQQTDLQLCRCLCGATNDH